MNPLDNSEVLGEDRMETSLVALQGHRPHVLPCVAVCSRVMFAHRANVCLVRAVGLAVWLNQLRSGRLVAGFRRFVLTQWIFLLRDKLLWEMVSALAKGFKGWNKMSLEQTNWKLDNNKAKETAPFFQGWQHQLMFKPTCKLSVVQQQNKIIFDFYFQHVGTEAPNAAGEGSFRITRMSGMERSDPAPCGRTACTLKGSFFPVLSVDWHREVTKQRRKSWAPAAQPLLSIKTFLMAQPDIASHQGSPQTYGRAHMKVLISSQAN